MDIKFFSLQSFKQFIKEDGLVVATIITLVLLAIHSTLDYLI